MTNLPKLLQSRNIRRSKNDNFTDSEFGIYLVAAKYYGFACDVCQHNVANDSPFYCGAKKVESTVCTRTTIDNQTKINISPDPPFFGEGSGEILF